jgi:NNP family nitrate/nitrite transporter-like MFS transporter
VNLREFRQAGHWPTLLAAFLYFDFSFMVWVTLGPLITYITKDLGLPVAEKFTLVAIPILAAAAFRILLGALADHIGAKITGLAAQALVIAAIAYTSLFGLHSKLDVELLGIALGIAGASFAVALPQASRWYPPRYQGVVMGIAGAGNMGVVIDALTVPWLAERFGWQNAFGFLLIPLVVTFVLYAWMVKEAPEARKPVTWANYKALLADRDSWWFMFFYSITFGGFVGLANSLPLYFTVQYHASGVAAGMLVALIVLFGSVFRPVGGYLADRVGGIRTLQVLFVMVSVSYFLMAFLPEGAAPVTAGPDVVAGWSLSELPSIAWLAMALFCCGALALGMGNGAVFQLVPLRFRKEVGTITGLVGAAGGLGGFLLAKTLGLSKGMSGDFMAGFLIFSGLPAVGLVGMMAVKYRWRTTWGAVSGARV